eukprot:scaffold51492_cov32-Tisochrysis_lutea.AAC.1
MNQARPVASEREARHKHPADGLSFRALFPSGGQNSRIERIDLYSKDSVVVDLNVSFHVNGPLPRISERHFDDLWHRYVPKDRSPEQDGKEKQCEKAQERAPRCTTEEPVRAADAPGPLLEIVFSEGRAFEA